MRAWTLPEIRAKVAGDLTYVDGVEAVKFQQLDHVGNLLATVAGVNGFGLAEQWTSVDGLEVIARRWCLQSNQMAAITRIRETDQVVQADGAVWVLRNAELIIWDTQWAALGIRIDCLIDIAGTTIAVERIASTRDAAGGTSSAWVVVHLNVPARFQTLGSREDEEFGKKHMVTDYAVFTRQAGICVGHRLNLNDRYYRVTDVQTMVQRNPNFPTWYRIGCERRQDLQG